MTMKILKIAVDRRDSRAAQDLFAQGGLSVTGLAHDRDQCVYRIQVPERRIKSTIQALQNGIRSFCLCAVSSEDEDGLTPPASDAPRPFRAQSEADARESFLPLRLFGFKRTAGR